MAAKRLNIRFVIILATVILVSGVAAFVMLKIQSSRQLDQCYQLGLEAFEKGDMAEVRNNLGPVAEKLTDSEERADAMRKLTLAYIDLLEQPNKSHRDLEICQLMLGRALQLDPIELGEDRVKFKEAFAQSTLLLGRHVQAAQTYLELSNEFPDEPKYLLEAAECYIKNKNNKAVDTLSKLVSRHQDYIPGWIAYAQYYQSLDQLDLAMQHLNSMVDANSDSAQAFAQRAIFLYMHPEMEQRALAEESALSAIRLDENNVDALLAGTKMAISRKKYDIAHQYLDRAMKLAKMVPDAKRDQWLIDTGIQLADAEGKPESALDLLKDDVESDPTNIQKHVQLFQRLIVLDRMEEARKEIDELRKIHTKLKPELLGFFEATIEIREEKWLNAVKKLEAVRAFWGQEPVMLAYIDRQRALCYGKLGQQDKQFEAFQKAIQNASESECVPFYLAYIHALHSAGRIPQMEEVMMELMDRIGEDKFMGIHELRTFYFALQQQKEASKPKDEQNWDSINKAMTDHNMDVNNPEGVLLSVRMLVKQDKVEEAKTLLNQAIADHPNTIAFVSYLALLEAQEKNYKEALALIDKQLTERKNNPGLLITKVRILSQIKEDDGTAPKDIEKQLKEIEDLAYKMPDAMKIMVLKQIAMAWLQYENLDEADRIYSMVIQVEPENVGIKIQLFDLARKADNEQKMTAQMERIRRELGISSPEYRYCQATKAIWEYGKKPSPDKLRLAKEQLTAAQQLRPAWVYIPRAQAEIAIIEKDYSAAIDYLNRVDQVGTLTTQQLNLLIRLLYLENRDPEVRQLIAKKREANLAVDAAMMSVEALANSGEGDEAVRRGSEIIDPNNPKDFLWIGHIAMKAKDYQKAQEAFLKVTEIAPENPNGWLSLLQVQRIQGEEVSKDEFIAKVTEAVPADKLPLCLAKTYQLFGEAKEAEKTFLEAVKLEPDSLEVLFSTSQFYMCTTHPEMAIPYLKRMSELITEDRRLNVDTKNQQLAWTRRSLAQVYSGIPNYELQSQGLQLVEENLTRQPDSLEDMKVKAMLLAARHNPEDNQRAIEIFDSIPLLSNRELFTLAKLYFEQSYSPDAASMKEKCQSVMSDLVSNNETNVEYLATFLDMLFRLNTPAETISSYVDSLESLRGDKDPLALLYRLKLMALTVKPSEVQKYMVNRFPEEIAPENLQITCRCAIELEKQGQMESASRMWNTLVKANPVFAEEFMLFLSRQQGFTAALAYLQANQDKFEPKQQLNMISRACRHSQKTVSRDEYKQVNEYVKLLFRDTPDALELQMFMAHILELQGKFDEAIAMYNALLEKPFNDAQMASIENTLAYLLVLTGKDFDRAVALIDEATKKFPQDVNLRDSRAVVYMRSKERTKTDKAMEDLKYALTIKNEAMFQFHLAVLYWNRANVHAAKIAFETAKRLDPFLFQNISALEVPNYTELTNNLE